MSKIKLTGESSGYVEISAGNAAGNNTLEAPTSGTRLVAHEGSQDVTLNGNLTVNGVVSYEDVTNVDAVGIMTARSGLHVTGGSVGIGTITPSTALEIRTTTTNAATHYRNNASNGGAYFGVRATDLGAASAGEAYVYSYNSGINLLADGSGHIDFATGGTASKVRITSAGNIGIGGLINPGALLSIPAGESNTPRLAIESAVDDNDFTITQYEDGNGTYTMLGQNVKLNSGGNNTILDSAHRTAGILLDARNHGSIVFLTGGANAVGENVKIDSSGRLLINKTTNRDKYFNGTYSGQLQVEGTSDTTRLTQFVHNQNSASQPILILGKSRGSSTGSYTIVQDGDFLGTLSFQGADGDEMVDGARIDGVVNGTPSNDNMPTDIVFKTNQAKERLRISNTGELSISGSRSGNNISDAILKFNIVNSNGDSKKAEIKAVKTSDISSELIFSTTVSHAFDERMRIADNGNIAVRNTDPSSKIHIGDLISSAVNDANTTHTSLIIKQTTNDNKSGFYIERSGERKGYYMWMNPGGGSGDGLTFTRNNAGTKSNALILDRDANIWGGGTFYPLSDNSYDLGSTSNRWRNVYTTDLQLSNEGSQNDVDGTWGSYTIQEGEDELFLINRRNGKKYKFNLTEVN